MKAILFAAAILFATPFSFVASAQEKNGVKVSVTKRTLNRSDRRDSLYYTRYDRTQGYKLNIKNTSFKPLPEGEVNWTILVRKAAYANRTEKFVGTEKLQALRGSEAVDVMIGAVPIAGYRYERDYKDEMDYDISISHGGKETIRLSSSQNFASIAKGAILMRQEEETQEAPGPRGIGPRTATPAPVTPTPPVYVPPTAPAPTPAPPPVAPTPTAPAPRTSAPATQPAAGTAVPTEEAKPYDFFNLKNKKAPTAQPQPQAQ